MGLELKGGQLLQAKLEQIAKKLAKPATLRVGFLEGATYPDGTSVATIAALLNYGIRNGKRWPFFLDMVARDSPTWGSLLSQLLVKFDNDIDKAFTVLGEMIAGDLRVAMITTNDPGLSPITLMLRKIKDERGDQHGDSITAATLGEAARRVAAGEEGATGMRAKVLQDSRIMINSITSEVVSG